VLPKRPLLSAKPKANLGSGIFRFLFAHGGVAACNTTP